jgi:hypothetical protein
MAGQAYQKKSNKTTKAQGVKTKQQRTCRLRAVNRVKQLLRLGNGIPEEVVALISRFQFQIDELTEAGITYEVVRAIEWYHPFLFLEQESHVSL